MCEARNHSADVPRKGNVDRNLVRLRAWTMKPGTFPARGTWIEMLIVTIEIIIALLTFPARGTWIEISPETTSSYIPSDVPRKGNVDRNVTHFERIIEYNPTFPARGTWIEIRASRLRAQIRRDVPRKGNVDRNVAALLPGQVLHRTFPARGTWIEISTLVSWQTIISRRSPQGERG